MSPVTVIPSETADPDAARARSPLAGAVVGIAAAAVVIGVAVALAVAWWLGPPVAILIAAAGWFLGIGPRLRSAEERVAALLGPTRPADPRAEARLLNLVEGLAPGAGLTRPPVLVIDDNVPNALAFGRDAHRGCLVATTGLVAALDRMQLEAVVAYLLVSLRDGLTATPTVALAFQPRRPPVGAAHGAADSAAVTLTRYPPALAGALRILGAAGPAAPAGAAAVLAPLWVAPPGDAIGLAARIEDLAGR
jgi:hypothetical protein